MPDSVVSEREMLRAVLAFPESEGSPFRPRPAATPPSVDVRDPMAKVEALLHDVLDRIDALEEKVDALAASLPARSNHEEEMRARIMGPVRAILDRAR